MNKRLNTKAGTKPTLKKKSAKKTPGTSTASSKQKKFEKDLIESEKRFRAVATSTSDLIWEGDVRNDMLTWFGDIDSLLGYETGEFPRTVSGHMESIHTDDRDGFIKSVESSLKTGSDFQASYRIRCKDGTYLHWEERGKAVSFENGKAVKWVGAITDISERKQAEKILIKSKSKFRRLTEEFNSLLSAIPDDLILLMPDMKIQWANKAFAAKFKMKASELYGKHCYKLCCNLSTICKNCPVAKSFKSGKEEATRVMNSEGKILDKRAFPILDEFGKAKNVIEVARDITAEVRMEEEAKLVQSKLIHANKMTSLGTLVSGVAHEINNPNSFILHNAGTLTKIWEDVFEVLAEHHNDKGDLKLANISFSELQTLVPELLNGINEGSGRINKIVTNLRDFVRPEKGSMDEKVNLNTVVMTSRSILDNHINNFTDNFHIICGSDLPLIRGSVQKIEQVIINIIMNALQSLPDRKYGVTISTSHNKLSNEVIINIKDEGTGIPDNIIEHITEPFFTTRFDSGGTGLGLSISYGIVKEHKGSMEFKSIKGIGTTVSTTFPAIK
ncbi:MAG TPA: PAS domain-containing sensor histidine kinase [Nitrospirae bacterium]|nr:PAS domain-containing sensor histidine kinase [Nitrospirota bacterium]HDZ84379.1 PAS domain-containing sensor histidine kinase [Nitrospirota bacterium]